jgi:hypothetical protein
MEANLETAAQVMVGVGGRRITVRWDARQRLGSATSHLNIGSTLLI